MNYSIIQELVSDFQKKYKKEPNALFKDDDIFLEQLNEIFEEILDEPFESIEDAEDLFLITKNYFGKGKIRVIVIHTDYLLIRSFKEKFLGGWKMLDEEEFEPLQIDWLDIKGIKYRKKLNEFCIKFKNENNTLCFNLELILNDNFDLNFTSDLFFLIKDIANRVNENDETFDQLIEKYKKKISEEKYDVALKIVNNLIEMKPDDPLFYQWKGDCLLKITKLSESIDMSLLALKLLQEINGTELSDYNEDYLNIYNNSNYNIGLAYDQLGDKYNGLWYMNKSYHACLDNNTKILWKKDLDKVYSDFIQKLPEIDYSERKLIFIENGLPEFKVDTILPLDISNMGSIKFPPSHPKKGELYIGHPFKNDTYYPVEDYENQLFQSQVMELNHLLQCLGATAIKSENAKIVTDNGAVSMSSNSKSNGESEHSMDGKAKIHDVDASTQNKSNVEIQDDKKYCSSSDQQKSMTTEQHFNPKIKPYIPDDLVWYHHNDTWQSLAKQRLQGGLLMHEMTISTKNLSIINENERNKINEDFKKLVSAGYSNLLVSGKLSASTNTQTERTSDVSYAISKSEHFEQKIQIEFAPIDDLTEEPSIYKKNEIQHENILQQDLTENEKEYQELIEDAIEDGEIDDSTRKFLDKRLKRLNITPERATEIENLILNANNYTEDELDYIDMLEDAIDDGIIDEAERKFLDKRMQRLNITKDRASEIERKFIQNLNKNS